MAFVECQECSVFTETFYSNNVHVYRMESASMTEDEEEQMDVTFIPHPFVPIFTANLLHNGLTECTLMILNDT